MTKRFYKHKILLDENVYYKSHLAILNNLFDVKHITEDYNQVGLKDPQVYKFAVRMGRTLVTFNIKDFEELALTSKKIGVVGASNMLADVLDKKLTALFRRASRKSLLGKMTKISGESKVNFQ